MPLIRLKRCLRPSLSGLAILIPTGGCDSRDRRLADYAARATAQQARQNEQLAEQAQTVARHSQQLTAAAHDLVEQDAATRRELLQSQQLMQQHMLSESAALERQRERLDGELSIAALLPLLVTAYALRRLPEPAADELLLRSLIRSLEAPAPRIVPTGLPEDDRPGLPCSTRPRHDRRSERFALGSVSTFPTPVPQLSGASRESHC
jgi:hypothetical protein